MASNGSRSAGIGVGRGRTRGSDLARPFHGARETRPDDAFTTHEGRIASLATAYGAVSAPDAMFWGPTAAGDRIIAVKRPLASADDLAEALDRHGSRRGCRLLRRALGMLDGRSESAQEARLRIMLQLRGVTGLAPDLQITAVNGRRYRIDLAPPEHKIAIEYQGDYHREVQQFRADLVCRTDLEASGWTVILIGADHLRDPDLLSPWSDVESRRMARNASECEPFGATR